MFSHYADKLATLKSAGNHRHFRHGHQHGVWIDHQGRKLLNLSSNDYLGIASDTAFGDEFLASVSTQSLRFGASSSRLLTGNFDEHEQLEALLQTHFGRACLLFNSGYHMNIGILPALCDDKTLIIADKWVHASIIDGIRLADVDYVRYPHQDLAKLTQLIQKHHDNDRYRQIIIATESVFSMDGDITDLTALVAIKHRYDKVRLYVDEAHAVGVFGQTGLGVAQAQNVMDKIDFLVGTFGKALASVGGYLVCDDVIKDYLINTMRPLIFSTALPPINMAWTAFVFQKMLGMTKDRQRLSNNARHLSDQIKQLGFDCPSDSQIIPVIVKQNELALTHAHALQQAGFYVLPIRPPTVPVGTARIRICLTADISTAQIDAFCDVLAGLSC